MIPLPNAQPCVQPVRKYHGNLDVHSLFLTVQGEGPLAGVPAVFVRLYGCTLTCPSCDTDYTSMKCNWDARLLVEEIHKIRRGASLVVLTGGEPLRQPVGALIDMLRVDGLHVQLETNGTCFPDGMDDMLGDTMVVCSPKTHKIHEDIIPFVDHWKYVLSHKNVSEIDGLPTKSLGMQMPPYRPEKLTNVWVQPEDSPCPEESSLNLKAAIESCLKYGHRLCVQQHKFIGMP